MDMIPSYEVTIFNPEHDHFKNDTNWTLDKGNFLKSTTLEKRYYYHSNSCGWKFGQAIWAIVQTIFSLGFALISEYTRRTWQQACSGKEYALVHIQYPRKQLPLPPPGPINVVPVPIKPPVKPSVQNPPKPVNPKPAVVTNPTPQQPVATKPNPQPVVTIPVPLPQPKKTSPIVLNPNTVDPNALDLSSFSKTDRNLYNHIEMACKLIDDWEPRIGSTDFNKQFVGTWTNSVQRQQLVQIFDEIIRFYENSQACRISDHFSMHDAGMLGSKVGQQVQGYFANVNNQSTTFSVKLRSLQGMRNLVQHGAEILGELNDNLFKANREFYPARTGLDKLYYFTGNAVDLETPLGPNHTDATAIAEAKKLIEPFIKRFHDFVQDFRDYPDPVTGVYEDFATLRKLNNWEPNGKVRVADGSVCGGQSHLDRGYSPVWKRDINLNGGGAPLYHYFANVPNIKAVVGSLLLGPMRFIQNYLILKSKGLPLEQLYGDNSLSTKCFNDKLETAVTFNFECLEHLKPTKKSVAIAQYGQAAVDTALTEADLSKVKFFENPKLNPQANQKWTTILKNIQTIFDADKNGKKRDQALEKLFVESEPDHQIFKKAFKKQALKTIDTMVQQHNWSNALYFDGEDYRPFNRDFFNMRLDKFMNYERVSIKANGIEEICFA